MDGSNSVSLISYNSAAILKVNVDCANTDVPHWHHHRHVHHHHRTHGYADVSASASAPASAAADAQSRNAGAADGPAGNAQAASLTYQRTEKTALVIRTQDGDTVALKIKTTDAANAGTATAGDGGTLVSQLDLQVSGGTKIAVFVHGNLSSEELAAIKSVVQQAGDLANQFFGGDVPSAFAAAADLNVDSSQLAKVGLRLSVREQATYAALGDAPAAALPASTPATGASDATTPGAQLPAETATPAVTAPTADAVPATTDPATADPSASAPEVPGPQTADTSPAAPAAETADASASTDTAAPSQAQSVDPAVAVLRTVSDFLSQLLETLGATQDSAAGGSTSLDLSLKIKIFQSIVVTASSTVTASDSTDGAAGSSDGTAGGSSDASAAASASASASALPSLVPDTLDALAAASQPPLNQTA